MLEIWMFQLKLLNTNKGYVPYNLSNYVLICENIKPQVPEHYITHNTFQHEHRRFAGYIWLE